DIERRRSRIEYCNSSECCGGWCSVAPSGLDRLAVADGASDAHFCGPRRSSKCVGQQLFNGTVTYATELLEQPAIAGLAAAIVAIDDGNAVDRKPKRLASSQPVGVLHIAETVQHNARRCRLWHGKICQAQRFRGRSGFGPSQIAIRLQ